MAKVNVAVRPHVRDLARWRANQLGMTMLEYVEMVIAQDAVPAYLNSTAPRRLTEAPQPPGGQGGASS